VFFRVVRLFFFAVISYSVEAYEVAGLEISLEDEEPSVRIVENLKKL